jgi:serine/threonine-protein kinase HipA
MLLQMTTVNILVGNGDAHGKNFSLLHESGGALRLAPLYDVVSTLHYDLNHLAMYVDDVRRIDRVTGDRLMREARTWGLSEQRASAVIADLMDRAPAGIAAAAEETPELPEAVPELVRSQCERLQGSSTRRRPTNHGPSRGLTTKTS